MPFAKAAHLRAAALAAVLIAAAPAAAAPRVAVTIAPVADLVRRVGGPEIEVTTLLPPGASPHTFEPTTGAARVLATCRAVFLVGAGLDAWAARLAEAAAPGAARIDLSEGLALVTGLAPDRHPDAGGAAGPGADANPHYWLDPVLAAGLLDRIAAALAAVLPGGREGFEQRARAARADLAALDAEYRAGLAALPSRRLVTFHDSWPYLARRYGLEIAGVIELSPGREPSPRQLSAIVATIRRAGVRAVFAEPQLPAGPAEAIAREAGVRLLSLDPLGGAAGREDYVALMRFNLGQLRSGLGAAR